MARATTKTDLLTAAQEQFDVLWALVNSMNPEDQQRAFLFEDRDKNLRDVLAHLTQWHQMMISWHQIGTLEGGSPVVPGEGYTWRTLPGLNQEIWEKYQNTSLEESKNLLQKSHLKVMALIESHSNEELFSKNVYKWTKSTTLGAYFVSSTSSHYDWAIKKIRKQIKALG